MYFERFENIWKNLFIRHYFYYQFIYEKQKKNLHAHLLHLH